MKYEEYLEKIGDYWAAIMSGLIMVIAPLVILAGSFKFVKWLIWG